MFSLLNIINFLSYATIGIMFILIAHLKYSLKISLISFIVFIFVSYGIFSVVVSYGFWPSFLPSTILAIPAVIFSSFLVKNKDFKFVFSFFTATTIGFIIYIYARSIAIVFGNHDAIMIGSVILFYTIAIYAIQRFRGHYLNLQNQIQTSWRLVAIFSMIAYIFLGTMAIYPSKISERLAELPVLIIATVFVNLTYLIIYRLIFKDVEIYNEKQELKVLELNQKYHKSQLELRDIYYKYAYEDALTSLKNRRAFDEVKKRDIDDNILLITIDINDLKQINDQYGHQIGDQALIALAMAMKETSVYHDKIFRVGGDEFILIIDGVDSSQAPHFIKQIKSNLQRTCQVCGVAVSVAIGWSCSIDDVVQSIEEMVKIADQRMYEKKKTNKISRNLA